ncbi:bifunctional transcriptional activator/DNA repair enzyme AdaA [Bacillus sp. 2205SS5-2]|uniref:bifunctional transcriptional activator/DNA repair enzyme AdaA n=1 Tax=Bacillus sp. 2205SS5-2 TaxID=3109031 RepID=UPI0030057958
MDRREFVMMGIESIKDRQWKAIVENDSAFDGEFYYAVKSTGVYCRPSCKSRIPNLENVVVFKDPDELDSFPFRPCKRCKPDQLLWPEEEWVEEVVHWIDQHYHHHLTLEGIASEHHRSPFHLQRMFKRVKGESPLEYIQKIRLEKAAILLSHTKKSITQISLDVGIMNISYFTTLFKKKNNLTPSQYRKRQQKTK